MLVRLVLAAFWCLATLPAWAADLGFEIEAAVDVYRAGAKAISSDDVPDECSNSLQSCQFRSFDNNLIWDFHYNERKRVVLIEIREAARDVPRGYILAGIALTREMLAPQATSETQRSSFAELNTLYEAGAVFIRSPFESFVWTLDRTSGSSLVRIERLR